MAAPFVTDVTQLFANAFAEMVSLRSQLGLPAMIPTCATNFQIGGEFAPEAQSAPRVVIIPTRCEYDYSQPMPITQTPTAMGRVPRKLNYRRWMYFDAQIWGDPDLTPRDLSNPTSTIPPDLPAPWYGFNSTIELEREFINCIADQIGLAAQAWQPMGSEWLPANAANNRYGRILVLSFRIATQVAYEPTLLLPYSQTPGDGGVCGSITITATVPQSTNQSTVTIEPFGPPPPDPNAPPPPPYP